MTIKALNLWSGIYFRKRHAEGIYFSEQIDVRTSGVGMVLTISIPLFSDRKRKRKRSTKISLEPPFIILYQSSLSLKNSSLLRVSIIFCSVQPLAYLLNFLRLKASQEIHELQHGNIHFRLYSPND
jgi:hypothetical protein